MEWLARTYVHAMNCIHYMHDKYFYERLEMALHDRDILRTMAFGIAGLSVVADSLAAIKYANVRVIRDDTGLAVDYVIEGTGANAVPQYGNNDDRVDSIAADLVTRFMQKIRKHPTYRNATHTQSVLTITSNVVYGKATGNTPDGRRKGEPFGPGANPMHGRDSHGWLASCLSLQSCPTRMRWTASATPCRCAPQKAKLSEEQLIDGAVKAFDMYFDQGGFHMNLNVVDKETLEDAMKNPDKYPQLTIRVSGYAVNFVRLTPRAAAGRDQPDVPRPDLTKIRSGQCHSLARWKRAAGTICVSDCRRMRPNESDVRDDGDGRVRLCSFLRIIVPLRRAGPARCPVPVGMPASLHVLPQPRYLALKDGTYVSAQHVIDRLASLCAGASLA